MDGAAVETFTANVAQAATLDVFAESPAGLAVLRRDGTVLRVNPRLCEWLGRSAGDTAGLAFGALLTGESAEILITCAWPVLAEAGCVEELAVDLAPAGAPPLPMLVSLRLGPADGDGAPTILAAMLRARSRSGTEAELIVQRRSADKANARLKAVFDHFPGAVTFVDGDLQILMCNDAYKRMLDLPDRLFDEGLPNLRDVFRLNAERGEYGPADVDDIVAARSAQCLRREPQTFDRERPDGTVLEIRSMPMVGGGMVTTYLDVTARHKAQRLLMEATQIAEQKSRALELTMAHMIQGVSVFDRNGCLMTWNQRYIELFEMEPEAFHVGVPLRDLLAIQARNGSFTGSIDAYLDTIISRTGAGQENRNTTRMASGRIVQTVHCPAPGGGWVSTHEDVTEREQAAERIVFAAHHDILTGLTNRAGLKARLQAGDHERHRPFGILMVDLDRFKAVNDTFGHAVGDRLLQIAALRMREAVRPEDIVARLGGDEFAVYQPNPDGALALAHRLRMLLSAPYDIDGRQLVIGASVGVATAPQHGMTLDELIQGADAALYDVKETGRGAVRVFDDALQREASERRELERDLRRALAADELELHYQPVVRVSDRAVIGMEALLRWRHRVRGLVGPDTFIPIAERSGLIASIGAWVLKTACMDATAWPDHVTVAVNVSVAQLGGSGFVETVFAELLRSRLDPRRLELEVTESVLLRDDVTLLEELHTLRRLGVRIALDDFGTGHSSLSYLRLFPFDKIKIDRSFVRDIGESRDCAAIVVAVAGLACSLGVDTTAEGVETESQFVQVAAAGCDTVQGFLFDKPRPKADLGLIPATGLRRSA